MARRQANEIIGRALGGVSVLLAFVSPVSADTLGLVYERLDRAGTAVMEMTTCNVVLGYVIDAEQATNRLLRLSVEFEEADRLPDEQSRIGAAESRYLKGQAERARALLQAPTRNAAQVEIISWIEDIDQKCALALSDADWGSFIKPPTDKEGNRARAVEGLMRDWLANQVR